MARQRISYFPLEKMMPKCAPKWSVARGKARRARKAPRCAPTCRALLVLRELLARYFPHRRLRSRDQGVVPALRLPLGDLRILRQPALDQGATASSRKPRPTIWSTSRNPPNYGEREKAALAYAEAITWRLDTDDAFWERMHEHFNEPELVELGCFVALTMGQQSWLRLLNIEHHQVMAGTAASMAPGFETAEALAKTKASPDYWAKKEVTPRKTAA